MKKINIKFNGMVFQLPANAVQTSTYGDKGQYIYMGAKHTASIIKQYVKQKYGNRLTVWSTSDVYSGGSSVRVNVWSKNGSPTPYTIFEDIQAFSQNFKAGSFNGMYDTYEYRDDKPSTDGGTRMDYFPSYIFVENKPQWDSVEYWLSQWKEFDESRWNTPIPGDTTWDKFVNHSKRFWKRGTLEKLTKYMANLEKELLKAGWTKEELEMA